MIRDTVTDKKNYQTPSKRSSKELFLSSLVLKSQKRTTINDTRNKNLQSQLLLEIK